MHRQTDGALLHALRAAKVLALALVTGNPAPTRHPCWLLGLVLGTWLGGSRRWGGRLKTSCGEVSIQTSRPFFTLSHSPLLYCTKAIPASARHHIDAFSPSTLGVNRSYSCIAQCLVHTDGSHQPLRALLLQLHTPQLLPILHHLH